MRNFSDKIVIKTHILFSLTFYPKIAQFYEIKSKNVVEPEKPYITTRRMRFACCKSKCIRAHVHANARLPPYTYSHTHIHIEIGLCDIYCVFHSNNGFLNAPHCYFIRTMPVLLEENQQKDEDIIQ